MAIAPSGNGWGTYKTSAGRIENIQAAEHLARFLEDSQLLLWLAPSTFVAMESKSTLAADDTIYHAVSATILYLTAQSKIQPLVYQSGIPYYSQEVFEKVLLEMFGQHLDCTGLLQPVQIETHEEEAIPIKYPLAGAAYRVTLLSQQDSSSLYAGTPESAAAPSSEATVSLTYYLPSSAQVGEILFMPGERPYRISVQSNVSWEYLPFCFLGMSKRRSGWPRRRGWFALKGRRNTTGSPQHFTRFYPHVFLASLLTLLCHRPPKCSDKVETDITMQTKMRPVEALCLRQAHLCSLHLNGSTVLYRAGLSYSHSIVRYTNFDKRLSFH